MKLSKFLQEVVAQDVSKSLGGPSYGNLTKEERKIKDRLAKKRKADAFEKLKEYLLS